MSSLAYVLFNKPLEMLNSLDKVKKTKCCKPFGQRKLIVNDFDRQTMYIVILYV